MTSLYRILAYLTLPRLTSPHLLPAPISTLILQEMPNP